MGYSQNIQRARQMLQSARYLQSVEDYLDTDLWHVSPKDGFAYESQVNAYIGQLKHEKIAAPEVKEMVEAFASFQEEDYANPIDQGVVRYLRELHQEASLIPASLQMQLAKSCKEAQRAWEEAYRQNDFESVKPYLKEQFGIQKKIAQAIDPHTSAYQVLVRRNDDYPLAVIDGMFDQVKLQILEILERTQGRAKKIDSDFLEQTVDKDVLKELVREMQNILGVDWNKTVMFETRHPVCTLNGPRDSRIAIPYGPLLPTLLSAAHESGHAIYNYSASEEVIEAGLWGGPEGAMHESQSKFYENLVCRSAEFWEAFHPILQKHLPSYRSISLEQMLQAINKPQVKLRRLSSDALTTPLHIIIRYELERDFFEDKLGIDDLKDAWNAKYKTYLGVEPTTDTEGILQDVHWFSGYVGYFQGYLLGEIYASQFQHKMLLDKPRAYAKLAQGDSSDINTWLRENIYAHGRTYSVAQTIEKATGEKLRVEYYLAHLRAKFLD